MILNPYIVWSNSDTLRGLPTKRVVNGGFHAELTHKGLQMTFAAVLKFEHSKEDLRDEVDDLGVKKFRGY